MGVEEYYGRDTKEQSRFEIPIAWRGGAVAGFIATVATGIAIMAIEPTLLSETIAGMYGMEGLMIAGWIVHLFHGTLFGVGFAAVLSDPGLVRITNWIWKTVVAGLVFGLALAVMGTGFILPVWVDFVGVSEVPEIPFMTTPLLIWHATYGMVLGLLFPFLEGL